MAVSLLIIELIRYPDFKKARVKRECPYGPYGRMSWDIGPNSFQTTKTDIASKAFASVFMHFICAVKA